MSISLIGVLLVVGFCLYTISRIRVSTKDGADGKRRKAIWFYVFIMILAVFYFMISYLALTTMPFG